MYPIQPLLLLIFASQGSGDDKVADSAHDSAHDSAQDSGDPASTPQDILSADLQLDLGALSSVATISALPAPDATELRLDVQGLDVSAVTLDGAAITPTIEDGVRRVAKTRPSAAPWRFLAGR